MIGQTNRQSNRDYIFRSKYYKSFVWKLSFFFYKSQPTQLYLEIPNQNLRQIGSGVYPNKQTVSEFKEFEPRLKSAKNRFQLKH